MPFGDGIVNFWGDLKDAWHNSALPGQPGYIGPEPETEITQIKPSVAETQNNMTVPVANYNYDSIYGTPNEVQGFGIGSDRPYVSTPMGGTAVQQRPWKPDEIDISTVGTHNSGDRGYDNVGNLLPGWELGIDNIPYNTALFALHQQDSAGGGGGGGYSGGGVSAPSEPFLLSQDLSQRTPSGTMYAPDLSAYRDSSLFNYTGPGGLSEYTYGQGLPYQGADYSIWGTPTDMVNPYYTGQFAPESTGIADGAISLPPVDMPAGVSPTNNNPNVGTSNANIVPQGTGPGGKDLTYQETLDYFGLDPVFTHFPGPNDKLIEEQILNQNAIKSGLDRGGVHDTGAVPPTADQLRALSDMNYGKTPYSSLGNPHIEPLRTIDRQRLTYGKPLEMPIGDNLVGNEIPGQPGILSAFSENDLGMVDARRNYLFNRDLDLGRPGDASYEEFVPNPSLFTDYPGLDAIVSEYKDKTETDYGVLAQAKADQMMANLTDEELRDGLFIEPDLKVVDGEIVGRMGIPDIFTQDKSPIEPRSTLFDDPFEEFDPDNPYREPDRGDNFIWQDKFGEYHNQWDDMGLETYIPGSYDEDFMSGKSATEAQEEFYNSQQVENEKAAEATRLRDIKAQEEQAKYIKNQLAARNAVLEAQAVAKAQAAKAAAEAQAQAEAQARAQAEARTQAREQARQPVYTAPAKPAYTAPVSTGSSWSPSYGTGGIWRL